MKYMIYFTDYDTNMSFMRDACEKIDAHVIMTDFAFDQTWSNTATIFSEPGGVAGQGFTSKTLRVVHGINHKAAVYVIDSPDSYMLAYVIEKPNDAFWHDVHANDMEFVYKAKEKYEIK